MNDKMNDLYIKFRKPLLYFIENKISEKDLAQDLLHEVFIKASKNIHTLEKEENIQAWLYMITKNIIIDYYRKNKISTIDNVDDFFTKEQEEYLLNDLSCCLKTYINNLPKKQSKILKSLYFSEVSLVEYAQEQNINLSTAKSQSKRAKEKLKNLFEECCLFSINKQNNIVDYSFKNDKCACT